MRRLPNIKPRWKRLRPKKRETHIAGAKLAVFTATLLLAGGCKALQSETDEVSAPPDRIGHYRKATGVDPTAREIEHRLGYR